MFSVLAVSFWVLQVVQHAKFEEMAENNHQRTLALRAPRGVVFDRNGKVLVENRHSYSISIVREHTKDLEPHHPAAGRGARASTSRASARSSTATAASRPTGRSSIVQDATLAQVAAVTARRLDFELPDVVVEQVPTRQYPETMAAHLFGYVGEVNDAQVAGDDGAEERRHRRPVGHREGLQRAADGRGRRASASSSTASAARSGRSRKSRRPKASGCS